MAALAIPLVEYSDSTNSRTYTLTGHTTQKPKLVIQKRIIGDVSSGKNATDTLDIVFGTQDSTGAPLPNKVGFSATIRRPVNALDADVTAALAAYRALVASDEFAAMVVSQNYVK